MNTAVRCHRFNIYPFASRWLWLILGWGLFSTTLPGQSMPTAAALTTEEGLGFRNVAAIGQDGQGLMWFGTQLGLNRYDGSLFIQFSGNAQAGHFFPGDEILNNSLVFVSDTIFWVVADGLLYAVNTADFSVEHISAEAGVNGSIWQLKRGADGTIWLVWEDAQEQHLCYTANGIDFVEVATVPRLRREFTSLTIDTSGNAWWSTSTRGLQHYTPDGQLLSEVKLDSFVWFGTTMFYTPVMVDSRNRLFVLPKSTRQIWQYFPEEGHTEAIASNLPGLAYYTLEDRQGNLWFATKTGLMRWDTDGHWTDYSAVLHKALEFSDIHDLFEDRTNLLWVATDNGLVKMPIQLHQFQNYMMQPGVAWGNTTRGMFEDTSGRMYVFCEGGEQGLHRIDVQSGTSYLLDIDGNEEQDGQLLNQAKHFAYDPKENAAWTVTDKLIKIDLSALRCTAVKGIPLFDGKFSHNPLILLKNGDFLLGNTLERLVVYRRQTGTLQPFSAEIPTKVKSVSTEYFLENEDGSIWVATASEGLFLFRSNGKLLRQFSTMSKPALSNNHVLVLHTGNDGKLWIGTFGGGLNCFDPATKMIRVFTKKEGLSDDNVTGILSDDSGNIWVSTYNGLSCYRKTEGTFQSF
ncbi:MAG: two-component regulator propeller domain-containing protein, partial [Saprospiraceae bacterium]